MAQTIKHLDFNNDNSIVARNSLIRNPGRIVNTPLKPNEIQTDEQYFEELDNTTTPLTGFQFALSRILISAINNADYDSQTRTYSSPAFTCNAIELIRFMGMNRSMTTKKIQGTNNYQVAFWVTQMSQFQTVYMDVDEMGYRHIRTINWIKTADYNLDTGIITLQLNDEIFEYIGKQEREFTTYKLYSLMTLPRRGYAMPLYEIFMSYKSLIQQCNKQGDYYRLSVPQLRQMLGISKLRRRVQDFVRQIKNDIDILNDNKFTGFIIDYRIEKIGKKYTFFLRIIDDQQITKKTIAFNHDDAALYESKASLLYKNTLQRTVGKKFKTKVQSCYKANIPQGVIRAAIGYADKMSQQETIKSIQAYVINAIDLITSGNISVDDKFWKHVQGDILTMPEKECYGDESSALAIQMLLVNKPADQSLSKDEATPFSTYVTAAKYYVETEHNGVLKKLNYKTLANMAKWFYDGVDIRCLLTGIEKTCQQIWDDSKQDIVHTWEYVSKVIENDIKENNPYWVGVADLTLDEYKKNFIEE